jgi:hypothetical protein
LTSSFSICVSFISLSCFIALAKNSNTTLNKNSYLNTLTLFLTLEEMTSVFSPFNIMLVICFVTFIMLRCNSSVLHFFRVFIIKGCWILSKGFSVAIKMIMRFFFVLNSVYVLYHIYWFVYLELSLHVWNETNLILVYDLFDMLNLICKYFIEDFYIWVHWGNWPIIFFAFFVSSGLVLG